MVPNFNTITYAMAYEKRDITVLSRYANGNLDKTDSSNLAMSGYTLAPHLAISLKKVGIGFSIENSKNSAVYTQSYGGGLTSRQHSDVSASGLGFNLSSLPFASLQKDNKLAVIIGGKSLTVKHQYSEFASNNLQLQQDPTLVRYNLLKYEAGVNLTLQLLKQFSVIPWIDYSHADTGSALAAADNKTNAQLFENDVKLFWQSYPDLRYGIDLGINAFGFDVRIGSFLGSLARLNTQPDYIQDKSFSFSLSFNQKGG